MRNSPKPDREAIAQEEWQIRRLRLMVDLTAAIIRTRPLSRSEAEDAVVHLRHRVLALFPDKGSVFDLIYAPRFRRLIEERFGSS